MQSNDDATPRRQPDPEASQQESQVALILARFGDTVEPAPENWRDTRIEYFVRKGFVMVREQYAPDVRRFLTSVEPEDEVGPLPEPEPLDARALAAEGDFGDDEEQPYEDEDEVDADDTFPVLGRPPQDGANLHGLVWIQLTPGVGTLRALRMIAETFGPGVAFGENCFHLADTGTCCPAEEPTPVPLGSAPDPPVAADRSAGAGVRVVVIDTGLFRRARTLLPWMRGVRGQRDPGITPNRIFEYAGHGTFIAGVVRTMAPSAEVIVRAGFRPGGVVFEKDLVDVLDWVLLNDAPDIINISGGTLADIDGPVLMNQFYERRLRYHKGIALVTAAGNDGQRRHFWPAAAPWAISVGALASNWQERADFSNFGGWVDVFAPGEQLVNAFPIGNYVYNEPPRRGRATSFGGMAMWSGTSFAAPLFAGLIAARMSWTGENGRDAATAVLRKASRQALLGVGPVVLPTTDVVSTGRKKHRSHCGRKAGAAGHCC